MTAYYITSTNSQKQVRRYIQSCSNDRMLNDTNRGGDIYVRKYFLVIRFASKILANPFRLGVSILSGAYSVLIYGTPLREITGPKILREKVPVFPIFILFVTSSGYIFSKP